MQISTNILKKYVDLYALTIMVSLLTAAVGMTMKPDYEEIIDCQPDYIDCQTDLHEKINTTYHHFIRTKIWELYQDYVNHLAKLELQSIRKHTGNNNMQLGWYTPAWECANINKENLASSMKKNEKYPDILDGLSIDLTWREIESIYSKYKIIQLQHFLLI